MNPKQFTLGADIEMFVKPNTPNSKIIPVCGLVGGTKEAPIKIDPNEVITKTYANGMGPGFFGYQEDGAAFEFNIPSVTRADYFNSMVTNMTKWSTGFLNKRNLTLDFKNRYTFPKTLLQANLQANQIGCSPDLTAYEFNGKERESIRITDLGDDRFCGGHLHLGYPEGMVPDPSVIAKLLDLTITLPLLRQDKQGRRRYFYGQAGLYRKKPYGMEYRTLSNFWAKPDYDDLRHEMARCIFSLMQVVNDRDTHVVDLYRQTPWESVYNCILNEDISTADSIIKWASNQLANRGMHGILFRKEYAGL